MTYGDHMDLKYMVSIKDLQTNKDVQYDDQFKKYAVFNMYQATKKIDVSG